MNNLSIRWHMLNNDGPTKIHMFLNKHINPTHMLENKRYIKHCKTILSSPSIPFTSNSVTHHVYYNHLTVSHRVDPHPTEPPGANMERSAAQAFAARAWERYQMGPNGTFVFHWDWKSWDWFTPPTNSVGNTSSNHWFSGDMLVFRGVKPCFFFRRDIYLLVGGWVSTPLKHII